MSPRAAFALVVVSILAAGPALAQQDDSARALQKKAMEEDYLALDFAKAQARLVTAVTRCGDTCSVPLRARLHRDLGVVRIAAGDRARGLEELAMAIAIDASITLDADVKTKELEKAFAEAKSLVDSADDEAQPRGDFSHTPAAEQTHDTPLPIYAKYTGSEKVVRVLVRYKGAGMPDWKNVELSKAAAGWQGLVPCADVTSGTMRYYVQGFDANGDPVALSGDRNHAYHVPIRSSAVAAPPHLPGAPPPTACTTGATASDCPPDFPGCGPVQAPPPPPPKPTRRLWIGAFGSLDVTFTPSADDVCKLGADALPRADTGYYCVASSGADYPSRDPSSGRAENEAIAQDGVSDRVRKGGATLGNVRVLVAVDYAATSQLLVGARLGVVLGGYPGEAAVLDGKRLGVPLHAELRATYVFSPLSEPGVAPYVFAGGGVAPFDGKVAVQVTENTEAGPAPKTVDAWYLAGPAFVTAGAGVRYALSSRFALMLGVRGNLAFLDAFAPSVGPELGTQLGF